MKDYIVFDLEWNQSASGKDGSLQELPFEIIEIGAVKLDETFRIVSEFHRLIRPKVYKEMHYKITEVTHMNVKELVTRGEDFPSAVKAFISWCGESPIFCTWGSMDLTELQRNMSYYGMEAFFETPLFYYDVQKLFSIQYDEEGKNRVSLDMAVHLMNIPEERPFHRALSDAFYTAQVLKAIDFNQTKDYISVDYFHVPQSPEEEIYLKFPSYSKYISRAFDSREDALEDKAVTDMVCYQCNRMLRKKVRWFLSNQKYYFGLAICPVHGFLKGKIRLKKTEDARVYAIKTLKLVEEPCALQVYEKKEEVKKKRHEKSKNKKLNRSQSTQE